jgi:hypothetical protein
MNAVTILSYCDTETKKIQLKNLIDSVRKRFPKNYILVYSHYQNVEPEYYEGSDFYIFDKSNPKSEKIFSEWVYIYSHNKKFVRVGEDWGYAVLQMIKRSTMFLKSIGVQNCLFLNYDCVGRDVEKLELDSTILSLNNQEIGIFSNWAKPRSFALTQFYLKIDLLNSKFFELINYDYYMQLPGDMIPEDIWFHIIEESFGDNYRIENINISLSISVNPRLLPKDNHLNVYFDTLLPTRDVVTEKKCLAIWNCKVIIDKIKISINGEESIHYNEVLPEYQDHGFFCHLDQDSIKEITVIEINGVRVVPYKLENLTENYWQNNFHTE